MLASLPNLVFTWQLIKRHAGKLHFCYHLLSDSFWFILPAQSKCLRLCMQERIAAEKNIKNTLTSPDSLLIFFGTELSKIKKRLEAKVMALNLNFCLY